MVENLGRLKRVDLRDIWNSEAADFTPWLALSDNLTILGETLDIDLELEAQEKSVGPFRADILCKDIGTDSWVLVENQLERTDHSHLGQLLTYASGLQAVTIVWVAARFTEEHRSTLDWLNKITDESFRFFGLEIELWQIGESLAAPKFNVVSKPNDWSRSVAKAARTIDESQLSETRLKRRAYWEAFNKVLSSIAGPVSGNRKAQTYVWMNYSIGRSNFNLGAVMLPTKRQVRVDLWIAGDKAKAFFGLLQQDQEQIDSELGFEAVWDGKPSHRDCSISVVLPNVDPGTEDEWLDQHKWIAERLNTFHSVFAHRIKGLDPDDWQVDHE